MSNVNLDWKNLGFKYTKTDKRYISMYKNGEWDNGNLISDENVVLNECAGVFQYAQTCFEGLKAYRTVDNKIVLFRVDLNAERMIDSCKRLVMPTFPKDRFIDAVKQVVAANADYVPPYGTGGSLYIRPYMFGYDAVIAVLPSQEFQFRIFTMPVGAYFKGGVKTVTLCVTDYDRAAPNGTGHIKAGLNYAMSLYPVMKAHAEGFDENVYLDSATRTYIEETGGANIIFITKDGKLVVPKSDTILPSITRRSLVQIAKDRMGLTVEERKVKYEELGDFYEAGLCGTAAVLSPIGKIVGKNKEEYKYHFDVEDKQSKLLQLYYALKNIQLGVDKAPDGWIYNVV